MRHLSLLHIACLFMLCASCRKDPATTDTNSRTNKPAPNYFALPPNGRYVEIPIADGKTTRFYGIDSLYIAEGDMVFTPTQVELLKHKDNARAHITTFARLWRGGIVPYAMNSNLSAASQSTIIAAMQEWQNLVPGLLFVPRTTASDYIRFNSSTVNNSHVGRIGGQQLINLVQDPSWGVDLTAAEHEIGHAIGLFHEQSRTDRDGFIAVNWPNIRPGAAHNFNTFTVDGYSGANVGTFDFNSIMLYPSFISDPNFVFNTGVPAMTRLDGTTWGNNWWISGGDVETVTRMYGPPFCRMEYQNLLYNESGGGSYSEYYSEDEVIVRFYQDRACTIPVATTRPQVLRYEAFAATIAGVNWFELQVTNVPVGTTAITIGVATTHFKEEWGTTVQNDQFGYRVTTNYPLLLAW